MEIIESIPVWGNPEIDAINQIKKVMEFGGEYCALMADCHLGYSVPVGGVIAYTDQINVNGVGFDIACGNKGVLTDMNADDLRKDIYRTMNEVQKHISFGVGQKNNEVVDDQLFDDVLWDELAWLGELKSNARKQLGTVGSGNHYVDIFLDDLERVWIGVHFGSRGLGHTIATKFIALGGGKDGVHAEPVLFNVTSDLGEQYLKCMHLAGRYAYAGRDWVCSRVARILRSNIIEEVHNHHNFAWKESHYDKDLWVVRKGATPAFPGQKGFIGGSMGDYSFIIEGVEHDECKPALHSTIHGAGRSMGRAAAVGKVNKKTGEIIRPGLVSKANMEEWIKRFDVELRGAGVDESPHCYKRIEEVIHAHRNTIKVVHRLKPIGVCMAKSNEHDPFKD